MFRLLTFRDNQGDNRPGILVDESVYDIGEEFISVLEILNNWETTEQKLIEIGQQLVQHRNASGTPLMKLHWLHQSYILAHSIVPAPIMLTMCLRCQASLHLLKTLHLIFLLNQHAGLLLVPMK